MEKPNPIRAISLLSGGLDSQLTIRILQLQGIEIHAIVFRSLFFNAASAEDAASVLKTPIHIEEFTSTLLSLVQHPKHGFGAGMNPCIDCHISMLRRAGQIMEERGFHFISTGEVLNQRPMSQNRRALDLIALKSGYKDFIVRPLSAKRLPPTEPERRGWVDRNQLLELEGRSRKPQLALARQFDITDYPQPAGGCLLTDPLYAKRLKDLKEHEGLENPVHIARLRLGRHFRFGHSKLIVGRNHDDNCQIEATAEKSDLILKPVCFPGATGLFPTFAEESELLNAAAICARYSDCPFGTMTEIEIHSCHVRRTIRVIPAEPESIEPFRI